MVPADESGSGERTDGAGAEVMATIFRMFELLSRAVALTADFKF